MQKHTDAPLRYFWLAAIIGFPVAPWYPWFVTWFPQLSGFRDDPRMYALAKEIGLEHILDKVYAE